MRGRRLDRIVTIQRQAAGEDALGNPSGGWEDYLTTRARYIPAPGTEKFEAAATHASYPVIFEVQDEARTRAISTEFQILFEGKVYGIKGVEQPTRGAKIRLIAVADQ